MKSLCILLKMSVSLFLLVAFVLPATDAQPVTDPVEVEALKAFANKLGISQSWNFSVDPCSGLEGWNNTSGADLFQPAMGIECRCPSNSSDSSFCHVEKIAVVASNVEGQIAPEIGNFSNLNNLNLAQNVITGTLPKEIGSLSKLQYFTVGINKLTGTIPSSIGNLIQLVGLGIGTNNFSGILPREIGNLKSLEQIYMDSSGLGGNMPMEFGKLQKLQILWMQDNNFNGTFPVFLGNLTNLKEAKLYGNNFIGPILSSLGRLQKLETLYIGDVSSGGVVPATFNQLSKLNTLVLRNCELSGSLPILSNLTNLAYLDLTDNNFTGSIPAAYRSFSTLATLLLSSNNLTGALPSDRGSLTALQHFDVSSNSLSGPVPSWINSIPEVNLAGNHFNTTRKRDGTVADMQCLEGGSACNAVNAGRNFEFSVNSGGPRLLSSSGTSFSSDMAKVVLGTAYSNASEPWVVSISGYDDGFNTAVSTTTSITGTRDPILYQTARSSPSSLKYYGLGMVNGRYSVLLHFAEIVVLDNGTWTGLGRRFFDVYIQGQNVLKNFNIQKEAEGSFKALVKNFTAFVSNNVLEVELRWAGKGTCCSPAPHSYGPLISAVQVLPGFDTSGFQKGESASKKGVTVGAGVGVAVAGGVLVLVVSFLLCRRKRIRDNALSANEQELKTLDGKPHLFSFGELKVATKDFAPETKLGQGGFGVVYKGVLSDGRVVAIKQLSAKSSQGSKEFLNEATVISAVQHRNLVKLEGCCIEGRNKILVYEFLENNSLHQALFSSNLKLQLNWPTRFSICVGVARGLAYLHEESLPRIIHRDIKASNVLLDTELQPKIADFGLAKLFDYHQTHVSTRVAGTIGYLAPEYALRGHLTEKADVYSYGVLALEVVSGRGNLEMNLPSEQTCLLDWAWHLYESGRAIDLVDEQLSSDYDKDQVIKLIQVALLCSQALATFRPRMSEVVGMLQGNVNVDVSSLGPGYFAALRNVAPASFVTEAPVQASPARSFSVSEASLSGR